MVIASALSVKIREFCALHNGDSLLSRLRKKYPNALGEDNSLMISNSNECENILCFDDDWNCSVEKIRMILTNANLLKKQYNNILTTTKENDVYIKTINNLINRLNKMIEKSQDSCKVSEALSKAIQATIIKNYCCEQLEGVLDEFMDKCGFKRYELKIGNQIEDKDLDYIDMKNCIYIDVTDVNLHNTIIDKTSDTYYFKYFDSDEEEYYSKVISGTYSIGRFKE